MERDSSCPAAGTWCSLSSLPWERGDEICQDVSLDEIRADFLHPAVAYVFPTVVARYATDSQRQVDVTAGQMLTGAHYEAAVNRAKRRAALRMRESG